MAKIELFKLTRKQIKRRIIFLVILLILTAFAYYGDYHLTASFYDYSSDKIPESFDGFRIVQISDFHNSNFGPSAESVAAKVSELEPDIIVITGDFIDSRNTHFDRAIECGELLSKIAPTYYVNGNHELRFDSETQTKFYNDLRNSGVTVLYDDTIFIRSDEGEQIQLIGLNDANINGLERFVLESRFNIVLAHEPQYLHTYAYYGADLVFSGHAHGGQIRIPFTDIGLFAPDQWLFPKLTSGEHVDGDTTMFISRGIGNSALPVRVFNDPEIVVVDLHSA